MTTNSLTKQQVIDQLHAAYSELGAWWGEEPEGYMSAALANKLSDALRAAAQALSSPDEPSRECSSSRGHTWSGRHDDGSPSVCVICGIPEKS